MKVARRQSIYRATSFNEFVEYGRTHGGNIVNGMPWSFNFRGTPVTHETDVRYLIACHGGYRDFTPNDMLITFDDGGEYETLCGIFNQYNFNKEFISIEVE